MTDKKPVPQALAEFALEQLAEAGEQAAIDLAVQNVEILRAEIAKRDARIANLERLLNNTSEIAQAVEQELAALKARQPSAGVVLPPSPYMPGVEPEQLSDYERGEAQGRCDMWAEVARLNPCRAQAVPDGYVLVPVDPTPEMLDRYPFNVSAVTSEPMDKEDLRVVYQAMLAAAPSAKKED